MTTIFLFLYKFDNAFAKSGNTCQRIYMHTLCFQLLTSWLERLLNQCTHACCRGMCFSQQSQCTCCSLTIGKEIINDQDMIRFTDLIM